MGINLDTKGKVGEVKLCWMGAKQDSRGASAMRQNFL